MRWAVEEKEPYEFPHFLILSKPYPEITSELQGGGGDGDGDGSDMARASKLVAVRSADLPSRYPVRDDSSPIQRLRSSFGVLCLSDLRS